jgi:RNA polymerase sigma factor (sigma-70 family)
MRIRTRRHHPVVLEALFKKPRLEDDAIIAAKTARYQAGLKALDALEALHRALILAEAESYRPNKMEGAVLPYERLVRARAGFLRAVLTYRGQNRPAWFRAHAVRHMRAALARTNAPIPHDNAFWGVGEVRSDFRPKKAGRGIAWIALVRTVQEGFRDRDDVFGGTVRLAAVKARKFRGQIAYQDGLTYSLMGLIRSLRTFEGKRGVKIATYASQGIEQSITRGIANEGTTIRIPVQKRDMIKWVRTAAAIIRNRGDEPTPEAIIKVVHAHRMAALKRRRKKTGEKLKAPAKLTKAHVKEGLSIRTEEPLSFSEPAGSDDDPSPRLLGEDIAHDADTHHDAAMSEFLKAFQQELKTLDRHHRKILEWRFGLNAKPELTLKQIGQRMGGLSKERIRQLEREALGIVRSQFHARGVHGKDFD